MGNKDIEKYEARKSKREEEAASREVEVVTQDYDIEKLSLDELKLKYGEEKNKLESIKDKILKLGGGSKIGWDKNDRRYDESRDERLKEIFENSKSKSYIPTIILLLFTGAFLFLFLMVLFGPVEYSEGTLWYWIIIVLFLSVTSFYALRQDRIDYLLNKEILKFEEDLKKQKLLFDDIKIKIRSKKGDSLNHLINSFQKEFDVNSDKTVDIIQHDNEFKMLINTNQEKIINFEKSEGRDFIRQFVQLANFLNQKEKELQSYFTRVSDISILEHFDGFERGFKSQIQFYNVCRINSIQMVTSFINDDRVTFYDLYEKFDKFGVFNSHFQNQLLSSLNLLNVNISSLVDEIRDMSLNIESKLDDLISTSDYNADLMNKELNKLGSKIDVSNTIAAINTYQNYQTKKSLK